MALTKEHLKFFADFIEKNLGIIYAESNYFQLESRLEEIAKYMGKQKEELLVTSYDKITGDFRRLLLDVSTNNETSFFRDSKVFKLLENKILPDLCKTKEGKGPLKIWSAACSYGQEPVSISIILQELAKKTNIPEFEICCTDISDRVLDKAQQGRFSHLEVQRGLPAKYLVEYFNQAGENWVAGSRVMKPMRFKKLNLLEPFNHDHRFDLILCRNVLIYQGIENKKKVILKLAESLYSDGYLFLGATESMMGLSNEFETIISDGVPTQRLKKRNHLAMSA